MTKIIIYPDMDLDLLYDLTINYLHDKYHTHPSAIRKGGEVQDQEHINVNGIDTTQPAAPDGTPWGKYVG